MTNGSDSGSSGEVALAGGTHGPVVRIGDTVRREPRPCSRVIQQLLAHLERKGFEGAPRALGFDDLGREVLSYVPGDVAVWTRAAPLPTYVRTNDTLARLAALTRRFHDATLDFVAPGGVAWDFQVGAPRSGEVICHNDLGPWNTVFREGSPYGFIDWDCASPGSRAWDVAYLLYRFVPFQPDEICALTGWDAPPDRAHRTRVFCSEYGIDERLVLETLRRRIQVMIDTGVSGHAAGEARFGDWWMTIMKQRLERDMNFVQSHDWVGD